jgi:hypothetical protein
MLSTLAIYLFCIQIITCNDNVDKTKFLQYLSDNIVSHSIQNSYHRNLENNNQTSSKGIRCFWLEPDSLAVFNIIGLKRKVSQH